MGLPKGGPEIKKPGELASQVFLWVIHAIIAFLHSRIIFFLQISQSFLLPVSS